MNSPSTDNPAGCRILGAVFAGILICWLAVAFLNLYYFSYASMDSWCYAAPAITARAPLHLTMPFLGTFEGADKAWGLHWPGGELLTSIITPFLPHNPAVYVSIYICYWLLLALAVMALVRRLTGSPWLALFGFAFVVGDRICFSVTWLERYELLDGAVAITTLLAFCGRQERRTRLQTAIIAAGFFLMPLLHPMFSALGLAWVTCLGFGTWALKRPWKPFWVAAAGYAAGWATFTTYYRSRPWLYTIFVNHARANMAAARVNSPPGVRMFLWRLLHIGNPTMGATVVYLAALGGVIYLACSFWKSRDNWREFLAREELILFMAVALLSDLFLAQFNYIDAYWAPGWPFAVAILCRMTQLLMQWRPRYQRLTWGALTAVLMLVGVFLPARTYLWYKAGFVNMRGEVRDFAATLPQGVRLFLPEVFWDTFADGHRAIFMSAIPACVGDEDEKKYAAFIQPAIRSGDVLVTDDLQAHPTLIDPHQPGWKVLGTCTETYSGRKSQPRADLKVTTLVHGFKLTAYQKL